MNVNNLLNGVYHADGVSLPVTYELIRKPILFSDVQTRQVKRKSPTTKNELMRQMLRTCQHNQLPYRYVLADSWFSAKDNLTFIRVRLLLNRVIENEHPVFTLDRAHHGFDLMP